MHGIDLWDTSGSRRGCLSAATRLLDRIRGRSLHRLGQLGPISLAPRMDRLLKGSAIIPVGEGRLEQVLLLGTVSRFVIAPVVEVGVRAVLSEPADSCDLVVRLSMRCETNSPVRCVTLAEASDVPSRENLLSCGLRSRNLIAAADPGEHGATSLEFCCVGCRRK